MATADRSGGLLGWHADGDAVLVLESIGTTRHLQALPVDGSPPRTLTSGDGVLASPSIAADADRMAFVWQTPDDPADVYVSPADSWAPTAITDLHADVAMPAMGRTELLSWRSQDGRFEIEGLLTYPVGYEPGQRVPPQREEHRRGKRDQHDVTHFRRRVRQHAREYDDHRDEARRRLEHHAANDRGRR